MLNITQDIHSLTEFKKNTGHFINGLKKTGRPTVLTVNGRAKIVVMDAAAYQQIQDQMELQNDILAINNSLKDFENGDFLEADDVFAELKNRIGKPQKKLIRSKK